MKSRLDTARVALFVLVAATACSKNSGDDARPSARPAPTESQSVSKDQEDLNAYECANPHFMGPEKERCEFRVTSCRGGRNSESLICKRKIDDLKFEVGPAELVEVDGYLQRDVSMMYLTSTPAKDSSSIRILGDSCLSPNGKYICTYKAGVKLTVVGAFYATGGLDGEKVQRSMLVLDVWDGNRGPAPPLH